MKNGSVLLPFVSFCYFPIPHKFYGLSVYDKIRHYERTATALFRSEVDIRKLQNTYRLLAEEDTINERNLQNLRPGVIKMKRGSNPNGVQVLPAPSGSPNTQAVLQDLRHQVIAEIGIDPVSGQVSTDIEKSGNDASKTAMAIDNASAKIEGYARNFADNALRDIMWQILRLLVANKDSPSVQQLSMSVSGQPFILGELGIMNIMDKSDIVAKVGLGHQTGQQKIAATQNILELVAQLEAAPSQTLYRLTEETLKGWGYENPGLILQPLETYMQKAQEAMMMQQQQLQLQQQQAQMQAMHRYNRRCNKHSLRWH